MSSPLDSALRAYWGQRALQGGCCGEGFVGGNIFSDIGNFFTHTIPSAATTVYEQALKPAYDAHLYSQALEAIPNPYAQIAGKAVKFLGGTMIGGKGTRLQFSAAGKSRWIAHVRQVAQDNGWSYSQALADPRTSTSYHQAYNIPARSYYPKNRNPRPRCRLRARANRYRRR